MYAPGIDVVVVNYNTPDDLQSFVNSYLFQSSDVETSLYIIDVDPSEDTYDKVTERLAELKIHDLCYWPISYNCGYSGACNWAASLGEREVVAFFNADTKLYDKTLDDCYSSLMQSDEVGILGPLQVNSGGRVTSAGVFGTNTQPRLRGWLQSPSRFVDVRDDAISVAGSAYFVKRECWDEMVNNEDWKKLYPDLNGAMLPTPHYYEETFCSYFARHLGWKIRFLGTSLMEHEWHKASPKNTREEQRIIGVSRKMFRDACGSLGIDCD